MRRIGMTAARRAALMGGAQTYWRKIKATNPIAFWLLDEASGTTAIDLTGNGRNGTYNADVSTFPVAASGIDGKTWPTFSGDDRVVVYSAGLASAFNGAEGSVMIYGQVDGAARWTDGVTRRLLWLRADDNNLINVSKLNTNNTLSINYKAGGTQETVNVTTTTTDVFSIVMTWNKAQDRMIAYFNGAQTGLTQTGLGTWAGALGTISRIGVWLDNYTDAFIGYLGRCALWDRELSAAEVARIASVPPFSLALGTSDEKIRFVLQNDVHVTDATTYLNVNAAVNDVNDWKPNAFIINGDLGQSSYSHVFDAYRAMKQSGRPYYVAVGTHDEEEYTYGAGNPTTAELAYTLGYGPPFYHSKRLTSGDGTINFLCLFLDTNIYNDDPDAPPPGNSSDHSPGDRWGNGAATPIGGWWSQIGTEQLAWVQATLAADTTSQAVIVFSHFNPTGTTFTDWTAFADLLQADGRPAIGFCGHVHEGATLYTLTSTDTLASYTFYHNPTTQDTGSWTRVTLGWDGSTITIDGLEIHNYTDPGGWTITPPFTLAA